MLGKIARFEINYQLKSPAFIIMFAIFFLLSFAVISLDEVQVVFGNTNVNAPFAIIFSTMILSLFGAIIPTIFFSNAALRDTSSKMDGLLFSTPITKRDYLFGRVIGAFVIVSLCFSAVIIGLLIGSLMPWIDPETLGPFRPFDFVYALLVMGLPNMFAIGMMMFAIATLTRSLIATYIGLVSFFVLYFVSQTLLGQPELRDIAALADPLGVGAWTQATFGWTPIEQNTKLPPLTGSLLYNRLLWIGIGIVLFMGNYFLFSFRNLGKSANSKKQSRALPQQRFIPTTVTLPTVMRDFSTNKTAQKQFLARTGFEVKTVLKSITFWVLLVLGTGLALINLLFAGEVFGAPILPVTRHIVNLLNNGLGFLPFVVIVFYAADLMWRDKSAGIYEVIDATPTPNWAFIFPKMIAIFMVVFGLFLFMAILGISHQIFNGFTDIEIGQYFVRFFYITGLPLMQVTVLAIFFQTVFANRYLGIFAMLIYYVLSITLSNFGFEHNLYQYAGAPDGAYSDINKYGHFLSIRNWFNLYWTCFAIILLVLSYVLFNRGVHTGFFRRLKSLPKKLKGVSGILLTLALIGVVATGSFIFYNTNILNDYVTSKDRERLSVRYEKEYRQYENDIQPKIIDVNVNLDIYPNKRKADAAGTYIVQNKTDQAIKMVHVEYSSDLKVIGQSLTGGKLEHSDEVFNVYRFKLDTPMQPNEKRTLTFNTRFEYVGFRNGANGLTLVQNGTFLNNNDLMPTLGFVPQRMLQARNTRRKYGLEEIPRMAKLEDTDKYNTSYLRSDSDFVNFETIVSTVPDQTAIAPGYLEREWIENNRRYFHYKMDTPILNFFSFQSADYTIKEDKWNDVAIQIYHHKPHDYNVDGMIDAAKKSFDYFTENFSPFQYRQLRILEFPYRAFAQSFPNTVPFSERIGFITDTRDPEEIDVSFYVTSHEIAHQWWAHQVMGADVQGGTMLVEGFAQYSALMVMEKTFGEAKIRNYLKRELDRYLQARGSERFEELPLYRVENQQHIQYNKASLVMYALKDYVGEDVVNRSLQRLIELRAFKSNPYATSLDFLTILREEADPKYNDLITDLFEKITLYDLKADDVDVSKREDGRFDVTLKYSAKKLYADGQGRESDADITIPLDIGVFLENPASGKFKKEDVLYLQKHDIDPDNPVITIIVDQEPEFAGIDPYIKMIDRDGDNNVKRVN